MWRSRPLRLLGQALLIALPRCRCPLQDVAERIGREAARRHFSPRVLPCDAYVPHVAGLPTQAAVVFVASTTGQGEHPDNMKGLWRFLLRKSLPADSLAGVAAAVFGLGDSGEQRAGGGGGRAVPDAERTCCLLPFVHEEQQRC